MDLLVRWLHVLAALTWVGGMLFIALCVVPVARRLDDPVLRTRLVQDLGRRFRRVAWSAIGLLLASGLVNLWTRPDLLGAPRFHAKLTLVALALVLEAIHDFILGPRAGLPGADQRARVGASWVARANLGVVLVIVALGLGLRG